MQFKRCGFDPWVGKIPWRREWLPTSVFLPGEFHGQRSLVDYGPWSHKEWDMTEWLTLSLLPPLSQTKVRSQKSKSIVHFKKTRERALTCGIKGSSQNLYIYIYTYTYIYIYIYIHTHTLYMYVHICLYYLHYHYDPHKPLSFAFLELSLPCHTTNVPHNLSEENMMYRHIVKFLNK